MKITAEPRSDQWNADDFAGGPRTFTIAGVVDGKAEQKYDIELVEGEGRAWRPPLTMLRVLLAAWGDDATVWRGRRVTLYQDPTVKFGKDAAPGVRISHLSHLPQDKPLTMALTVTRGKRKLYKVEPLTEAPAQSVQTVSELIEQCAGNTDSLRTLYRDQQAAGATPDDLNQIKAAATKESN